MILGCVAEKHHKHFTLHLKSNGRDTIAAGRCDIKLLWDVTCLLWSQHPHLIKAWWHLWKTSHLPLFSKPICAFLGGSPSHFSADAPIGDGWPKKYLLCSRCEAGVGHASKPDSVSLAAGMSLQGYRLERLVILSCSALQVAPHKKSGRSGASFIPPLLSVIEVSTDVCQSISWHFPSPLPLDSVRTKQIAAVRWSFSKSVLDLEESTSATERSRIFRWSIWWLISL